MELFTVTEKWLRAHATGGKAWTKKQQAVFGFEWPAPSGWIKSLVGRRITHVQRLEFEDGSGEKHRERLREAALREPVYFTEPDGKGSFKGRNLTAAEKAAGGVFAYERGRRS